MTVTRYTPEQQTWFSCFFKEANNFEIKPVNTTHLVSLILWNTFSSALLL